MAIRIAPSILAADFANLERDIRAVANADWLHFDVMDHHFVPNLTVGLPVLESVARVSPLPVDAHLMIDDPERWGPMYVEAGAQSVTFHLEAAPDPLAAARSIRDAGARVGVAVRPGTPIDSVFALVDEVDMVLIMTVEPGFGGQAFMPETLPKFRDIRAEINRRGAEVWVQADGGVSEDTIAQIVDAGADTLVAGSAVYGADDPAAAVDALRALGEGAHHH